MVLAVGNQDLIPMGPSEKSRKILQNHLPKRRKWEDFIHNHRDLSSISQVVPHGSFAALLCEGLAGLHKHFSLS